MPDQSFPASSQSETSERNSQFLKRKYPLMGECELRITLRGPKLADGLRRAAPMELEPIFKTLQENFAKSLFQTMDGSFVALILSKQSQEKSDGSVELSLEIGATLTLATEVTFTQPSAE